MRNDGRSVTLVQTGAGFTRNGSTGYTLSPTSAADYEALLASLRADGSLPAQIIHAWNAGSESTSERSFFSLLALAQAIGREDITTPIQLDIISSDMQHVAGESATDPLKALLLGPCRVIPSEFPNITARSVDVSLPAQGSWQHRRLVELLDAELSSQSADTIVA